MDATGTAPALEEHEEHEEHAAETEPLVLEDMIVEEISIDGMCGVY
jgi:mycofactocin precursor